jgi:FG-GAP-like repeat
LHYNDSTFLGSAISGPTGFLTWTPFTTTHTFAVVPSSAATLYFIVRNRGYAGLETNTTPAGFRVEFDTPTGSNLTQAGGGDFNADGQTDVAVVDSGTNKVAVFLNDGKGFPKDSEYPVGTNPAFVAVGDLNGNGRPDLAVANAESGSISILSGEGGGKFQLTLTVPMGDFNGDGKLDLAMTDAGTGAVTILTGSGDGTFTLLSSIASEAIEPVSIVAADFNGDGKPDLAVADPATNAGYVLLGNGDGTFQPAVGYPAGSDPQSLIIGTPPPAPAFRFWPWRTQLRAL